jgi:hypothetical protein
VSARTERISDDLAGFDLDLPLALALPRLQPLEVQQRYSPTMGDPGPASLSISVQVSRAVRVYVAADLDQELPRLDCLDGDTYWMPGVELALTKRLRVFVEDFQPASGIVGGGDEDEPIPARSWDGHQVGVGARYQLSERVQIEAQATTYVLSGTNRGEGLGGMASLTLRF